jgi:hypothetical protein
MWSRRSDAARNDNPDQGADMPACKPDTLAYRTFLAVLGAAAALAVATHAAPIAPPDPSPFVYWDIYDTATIPKTLSAMKLYQTAPGKKAKLIPQFFHFEVNSPLWSDDSKKKRWVLTKPGRTIGFREKDDYWDYPDSTVFVKEFAIDTIPGDTNSRVLWETRVMINRKEVYDSAQGTMTDNWRGYTYKWDAGQKDARLVAAGGSKDSIRVWPTGTKNASRMKKWIFPSRSQCDQCHRTGEVEGQHGRTVLGFFTAQLNRPHPDSAGINQIDYFFAKGLLHGQKPYPWDYSPRWRAIDDNSASVDVRARSYIAANCSGCHGKRGMDLSAAQGVDLNYDFHAMEPRMEFRHRSIGWSYGMDTLAPFYYPKNDKNNPKGLDSLPINPALVVPGYPDKSAILFRQRQRNQGIGNYDPIRNQMPPLATFEVNVAATALIEKWIKDMPVPTPIAIALAKHGMFRAGIKLQRGYLVIDAKLLGAGAQPIMAGLDGRRISLRKVSEGTWALPEGLPKGLYLIRAGSQSALRQMF